MTELTRYKVGFWTLAVLCVVLLFASAAMFGMLHQKPLPEQGGDKVLTAEEAGAMEDGD